MIHAILKYIADDLNKYLRLKFNISTDMLKLSHLVHQDGSEATDGNKIVFSLIGMNEEKLNRWKDNYRKDWQGNAVRVNPPVNLNLYVIFSANFKQNYEDALRYLSAVISYFQKKRIFTPEDSPGLPEGTGSISFELVDLDLRELSNLWGALGAKYLPSAVYRIRTVSIQEEHIEDIIPVIEKEDSEYKPKA